MTERTDHLIERAAAKLRNAGAQAGGGPAPDSPPPLPPPERSDRAGQPNAPKFIPPPRPAPQAALAGPRVGAVAAPSASVADIRAYSPHAPVAVATLERAGLMVARSSRTRTSEEYRIVIGRVLRALHEEAEGGPIPEGEIAPNVVMITSARPGEGKSFNALNLGGSIAQNAGESVLIVDVDAKNQSMTDLLGLNGNLGYLDMVASSALQPEELIVPTELPNLSFLPLGTRVEVRGPDEEDVVHPEARRLGPPIMRLSQRFPKSLILLDAPPCLSTSDPHTLAPVVGQVVMVVEAERTQRNEVEAAIDLVRVCPMVTMLLNKVRMSTGHTFGSYDYFGSYT